MNKIHLNPLIILVFFIVYKTGNLPLFLISFFCLCLHELVHLFFLCKNKIIVERISIEPFGISIETNNPKIILPSVFLAAPIFNLITAGIISFFRTSRSDLILEYFFVSNIFLGVFNLLPVMPFDGGRAIEAYILKKKKKPSTFLNTVSLITGFILFVLGIFFLKLSEYNFSILMIGVFIIFNAICENENFKMRKEKTLVRKSDYEKKMKSIKNLSVPHDYPAHKLIKEFRGDDYYIVNIIKNGIMTRTVTETQIIESVINSCHNIQICDVY